MKTRTDEAIKEVDGVFQEEQLNKQEAQQQQGTQQQ